MALVKPLEENEIESELCEFIQFFKGPLGVIPNSVRTMSRRPKIARAFTELNMAVMECHGNVTPEFKRIHTIFSYKQKTYKHTLVVYHSHELFNSYCHVYDFDIPLENN